MFRGNGSSPVQFLVTRIVLLAVALFVAGCNEEQALPTLVPTAAVEETEAVEATEGVEATDAAGETEELATTPTGSEATPRSNAATLDNLHVPSPEWQDQIIYFLMIDRFNDGNPDNNDQGYNEYDPQDDRKFSGGDLHGIVQQLEYIQELGATAIWITPPVANQWWDPIVDYGGYHGYWAENFKEVDAHFGSLEDYQALSDALHDRGMYLIQDIVANHTGNFFTYRDEQGATQYDPANPSNGFRLNEESVPVTAPSQAPLNMNDVRDFEAREANVYHWTPSIVNYDDPKQRLVYQLADLDDLNSDNPVVRDLLRDSYGYWIREVGVDGFRVDTALYASHEFWHDFSYADDADAPGIEHVAAETGRDNFFVYGEAFLGSAPFEDADDREIAKYLGGGSQPEFDAVINFPMHFTMNRVFGEGQPTAEMAHRLELGQRLFPNPHLIPNFIDNHDVARFLSKASVAGLKQATTFLMTTTGIPVIYYGTEQGFDVQRASMFAGGWGSGGEDHFDTDAELYRHIQTVIELRKSNPLFTRGSLTVLHSNQAGPGALAFKREYEGQTAIVIFNTADRPVLLTRMETGLPAGTVLKLLFGLQTDEDLVVGPGGRMTMELPAREALVLLVSDETVEVPETEGEVTVETALEGTVYSTDFNVTGIASEPETAVRVILNGNLPEALQTTAGADGRWSVIVPITAFPPGDRSNNLVVYAPEIGAVSATYNFTTSYQAEGVGVTSYDRRSDDIGPAGVYELPTDETFGDQLDILRTRVTAFGTNLQVELQMADVTDVWGPDNGFDHVLFHVFVDVPGQEGKSVLPGIDATAPEGFAWDYMTFTEGWNNRLYASAGASEGEYGTLVTPAPEISVDIENNTMTLLFLSTSLGNPETLEGTRVYVTTWDWDGPAGNYRGLQTTAGQWNFGGGEMGEDPLILDDTDVIPVATTEQLYQDDPAGDAHGPAPYITYTVPSGAQSAQVDIREARLTYENNNLHLSLTMDGLAQETAGDEGFDNVAFHVFLDVPNREGITVLPRLQGDTPEGFAWDYVLLLAPTKTEFYRAAGANEQNRGTPTLPLPTVTGNAETQTVDMVLPVAALGYPASLEGIRAYVTTWLWDEEAGDLLLPLPREDDYPVDDVALILDDVLLGASASYVPPTPPQPQVEVTFVVTVPEGTPTDAPLYLTGPFNNWMPNDAAYQFARSDDGTYTLELMLDAGTTLEYRLTRGSFANAEVIDPDDRFANRQLAVPPDEQAVTVEVQVEGWWDQQP